MFVRCLCIFLLCTADLWIKKYTNLFVLIYLFHLIYNFDTYLFKNQTVLKFDLCNRTMNKSRPTVSSLNSSKIQIKYNASSNMNTPTRIFEKKRRGNSALPGQISINMAS